MSGISLLTIAGGLILILCFFFLKKQFYRKFLFSIQFGVYSRNISHTLKCIFELALETSKNTQLIYSLNELAKNVYSFTQTPTKKIALCNLF